MSLIGFHTNVINNDYLSALKHKEPTQVFIGSPKSYYSKLLKEEDYSPVARYVSENNIFFICHSPYILNFARPTNQKAIDRYVVDLTNIYNLGGVGAVLHMGANVKEIGQTMEECYKTFVENLGLVIERKPRESIIILENMAGGGQRMCCRMDEWADFWNNYVPEHYKQHIKWCVDTAHLYATGEYDISKRREVMRFYNDFDEKIGWEHLLCFHYNGSKTTFGSHTDKHADISVNKCGYIETKGMRQLARIAFKTDKSLILEIPADFQTPDYQRELIKSWK